MLIWVLLAIFLAMFCGAYIKFDKDIVAPAVVLVAGYTFSIICATANIKAWAIDLHWETVAVLTYGTGLFVVTGYLVKQYMKKKWNRENGDERELKPIEYNRKYVKYFCVYQILVMFIWVANIYYVTSNMGDFNSFSEMMVAFRKWSSYSTEWMGSKIYFIVNQFLQVSTISMYLIIYVLVYNSFFLKKIDWLLWLGIVLNVVQASLTGARGGMVGSAIFAVCYYFINYFYINQKIYVINKRFVAKVIVATVIGAFMFFYGKVLVGRGTSGTSLSNMIPYLTMYAGGPIQLLDMFLINPIDPSNIWGKETFSALNNFLARFNIIDVDPYIHHLEFRRATTGAFLGNVYTAYRSYIYDFGYAGLTILPIVFSAVVHYVYYRILWFRRKAIDYLMLFYAFIFPWIFFDFARCMFYSSVISFGTLKRFLFLILITKLFTCDNKENTEADRELY